MPDISSFFDYSATNSWTKIDLCDEHHSLLISRLKYDLGTSVETEVHGKRQLKLLGLGETYVMNSPKLLIRFLPVPGVDWVGDVRITCQETGLGAELCFRGPSLIGRNRRSIKGKIIDLSSSKTLYEVDGHWDSTVTVKDVSNGKQKVIYNAAEIISGLKTPQVKDSKVIETLPPYLYAQNLFLTTI